jgi:hypothetical protein
LPSKSPLPIPARILGPALGLINLYTIFKKALTSLHTSPIYFGKFNTISQCGKSEKRYLGGIK